MRIVKTYICMLLVFIASVSTTTIVSAEAEVEQNALLYEAEEFTQAFHFFQIPKNNEETLTRAELAKVVADAFEMETVGEGTVVFADVTEDTEYYDEILKVAGRGYMLGDYLGNGIYKFFPEEPASEVDALKVFIDALGYGEYVKLIGEFPYNYLSMANRIGLSDGIAISASETVTAEKMKQLIYRAYHSYAAEVTRIQNGEVYIEFDKDTLYLEEKLGLTIVEGIVTANNLLDLTGREPLDGNRVRIDETEYEILNVDKAAAYLGQFVKAYIQNNTEIENKIVCIYPKPRRNQIVSIHTEDMLECDLLTKIIAADESGKERRYSIEPEAAVFFNLDYLGPARAANLFDQETLNILQEAFDSLSADIRMVDNDNDGGYEFVWIRKFENIYVSDFLFDEFKIKNAYGSTIEMLDAYRENRVVFTNSQGNVVNPKEIEENTVLSICTSRDEDGEILRAFGILSTDKVEGEITQIILDEHKKYEINGEQYTVSEEYDQLQTIQSAKIKELKLGLTATFYLNAFGAISGIDLYSVESGDEEYGFLLKAGTEGKLSTATEIRLLTSDGEWVNYTLAQNAKINGERSGDEPIRLLENYSVGQKGEVQIIYKICRYTVRNGEISNLEIAVPAPADTEVISQDRIYAGKTIQGSDNINTTRYKENTFGKLVGVENTTVIFDVPLEENALDAVDDEKSMTVISTGELVYDCVLGITGIRSAGNSIGYMNFYDVSNVRIAPAAVRYQPYVSSEEGTTMLPELNADCFVVNKINRGVNSEGQPIYKLIGYESGTKKSYDTIPIGQKDWETFNITSYLNLTTADGTIPIKDIQVGDVLHLYLNKNGEVANFVTNVRAMDRDNAGWLTGISSIGAGQALQYLGVNYGEVIETDGGVYVLREIDGVERVYVLGSDLRVTTVDRENKRVSIGSMADIEVGDDIYVRQYYGICKEIVHFK